MPAPPLGLVAELTHRCPLRCPYCSNPLELVRAGQELDTSTWRRVFDEAAALGVLQLHLSGGEPTVRNDLPALLRHAVGAGLYTNLITSGVLLDREAIGDLAAAGLDHVQLSFQDIDPAEADRIGGYAGGHDKKRAVARWVREAGLALTLNFVVHRQNLERLPEMIAFGADSGAGRIEIAHVQYHGWAFENRSALLPSREQLEIATAEVDAARTRLNGRPVIDYVVPDYYAARPKACMGGWGQRLLIVTPAGKILPCHAAESLPGLVFPRVQDASLEATWQHSDAFNRFRSTEWMREPCRSCDHREEDWGGCRCQAMALAGDAAEADPICGLSPFHERVAAALMESHASAAPFIYRGVTGRKKLPAIAVRANR
ncbi:MAG: pqqE [Rhodospirillales bacterium]|nr:pqqE [Rhodospirillales bacterium]